MGEKILNSVRRDWVKVVPLKTGKVLQMYYTSMMIIIIVKL